MNKSQVHHLIQVPIKSLNINNKWFYNSRLICSMIVLNKIPRKFSFWFFHSQDGAVTCQNVRKWPSTKMSENGYENVRKVLRRQHAKISACLTSQDTKILFFGINKALFSAIFSDILVVDIRAHNLCDMNRMLGNI